MVGAEAMGNPKPLVPAHAFEWDDGGGKRPSPNVCPLGSDQSPRTNEPNSVPSFSLSSKLSMSDKSSTTTLTCTSPYIQTQSMHMAAWRNGIESGRVMGSSTPSDSKFPTVTSSRERWSSKETSWTTAMLFGSGYQGLITRLLMKRSTTRWMIWRMTWITDALDGCTAVSHERWHLLYQDTSTCFMVSHFRISWEVHEEQHDFVWPGDPLHEGPWVSFALLVIPLQYCNCCTLCTDLEAPSVPKSQRWHRLSIADPNLWYPPFRCPFTSGVCFIIAPEKKVAKSSVGMFGYIACIRA